MEQLEARRDLAIVMWQLALLAGDTGRLLNDSLAIARELDDWRGQAELLLELSKLRSDQGRPANWFLCMSAWGSKPGLPL